MRAAAIAHQAEAQSPATTLDRGESDGPVRAPVPRPTTTPATQATPPTTAAPVPPETDDEEIPANAYYNDVHCPDHQHSWTVGYWTGLVVATQDGGQTWHPQRAPTNDRRAQQRLLVNARKAWAAGWGGIILATDDGGQRWRRQMGPPGDFLAITFADHRHGWAVGDGGLIAATSNGGETWQV